MGCSPSRGNVTGAKMPFRGKTLLPGNKGNIVDSQSDDGGSGSSCGGETDGEAGDKKTAGGKKPSTFTYTACSVKKPIEKVTTEKLDAQEITIELSRHIKEEHLEKQEKKEAIKVKKVRKTSKNPKTKRKKDKEQNHVEEKVDFPEALVKAHKAAYGYLNPGIAKYHLLLRLLDHAAQTHLSLQPMVAFMALRFEEFNKGLEEMVEEGEQLLKDSVSHLAWPKNLSSTSGSIPPEPPPDLLLQLLQYTIQRMRVVGQSLSEIGDRALEEAVKYFSSISKVLEKKLGAKRAAEARLMQLLARIEAASIKRPEPDDSTLFSEDSGIGAESESLTASDKQWLCRERCGSTGSNHTICSSTGNVTPTRKASKQQLIKKRTDSSSILSIDSTCNIAAKEIRDTESMLGSASLHYSEVEGEDSDEEHCETTIRTHSSTSSPELAHQPRRLPVKRIENPQNVEMTRKLKDAISGRIHFVPPQHSGVKTKPEIQKVNDGQWTDKGEKNTKRPQTASRAPGRKITVTKQCRSRSADSLHSKAEDVTMVELERTQKELNHRMEQMKRNQIGQKKDTYKKVQQKKCNSATSHGQLSSLNNKLNSSNSSRNADSVKEKQEKAKKKGEEKKKNDKPTKSLIKATSFLSPPPSPGMYHGGNSVKKLIDTFSQGLEESKQILGNTKVLGPLKGVRKYGIPIIPGLGNEEALLSITNCGDSRTSDRSDDLNLDELPPPALEVLMDNSFENIEASKTNESIDRKGHSSHLKMTSISQRLRASMQSVTVLPSKGSLRKTHRSISPVQNVALDTKEVVKNSYSASKPELVPKNEEAASLYQHACKIIHLRHSSDSLKKTIAAENDNLTQRHPEESDQVDKDAIVLVPSPAAESQLPATHSTSKICMSSSTPVLNRRLPSPPVSKKQPISSSSPVIFRMLPTPPLASQRTLPTTPVMQQEVGTSSNTGVSYPFKAPSPPASPKVQRYSQDSSHEESNSRGFSNARSVFCPASPSLFEAQPFPVPKPPQAWASSGTSIFPRPWGEHSRLSMSARASQPSIRRSQSDRRPSLRVPPKVSVVSIAQTCGSEPAISTQGLEDTRYTVGSRETETWNNQLELRRTTHSASQPDLCIVGQALQCE